MGCQVILRNVSRSWYSHCVCVYCVGLVIRNLKPVSLKIRVLTTVILMTGAVQANAVYWISILLVLHDDISDSRYYCCYVVIFSAEEELNATREKLVKLQSLQNVGQYLNDLHIACVKPR